MRYLVGIAGLFLGAAVTAATPDRDNLIGSWELQAGGETHRVWTLFADGDSIRITQTEDDRKLSDVECNTVGRECDVSGTAKPAKVTMWFNGPKLVVMEIRGDEVLKRRFHVTGDAMELEIIPIVPQGKPEILRLTRTAMSR